MINFEEFKKKAEQFYADASKKVKQYTPEQWSPEKKFVNGIVISMALMTMADKKAETEEVTTALEIINDIQEIQDLEMTQEAIELYELHIEQLSKNVENSTKWVLTEGKLLAELSKLKEYPQYAEMIANLLEYLAKVDGNVAKEEVEMINRIRSAIGKES